MTSTDDHTQLAAAWGVLFELMESLPTRIHWGEVHYHETSEMAERVRGLALHLDSAVQLSGIWRYESALALVRTALEHCLVDWLVFQGKTLVQRCSGVAESTWSNWQAERASGAPWTQTIRDWSRTKRGDVRIVREGIYSEPDEKGERHQLSIYYFLLAQYQPTLGPPSIQNDGWAISRSDLRRMATENDALWRVYLTWSSLLTNLQENELVDQEDAGRLAAHYRFLSGYAHPVADHRRQLYGNDAGMGWPHYDHYSSELVLLYAVTIATLELRNFLPVIEHRPSIVYLDAASLESAGRRADSVAAHFWFLGNSPSEYDSWEARNESMFKAHVNDEEPEGSGGASLQDIPYPSDPLRRLIAMHSSAHELMTGLVYQSPWPRADARFR